MKFRNESERLRHEHIQKLKSSNLSSGQFSPDGSTFCQIAVLNRGEQMYFQLGEKAFICEISALHGVIYPDSAKKWDDGSKISSEERKIFESATREYWLNKNKTRPKFANKDGSFYE